MQLSKTSAEKILSDMKMSDMPLRAITPTMTAVPADWFPRYKQLCRQFMMSLTDSVDTLAFMNISQDEFMNLLMGRQMPPNLSFRLRVPLMWGGNLEIENMFICQTFPYSQNLDRFIISQAGAAQIWLPDPTKKVYIPPRTGGGGAGGNATEDRLTQMAAQMSSNRGME